MDWIIHYLLPFLIVLTILVFVHEFGHFYIARRNGVSVTVFSIGFGPELFGWNDKKGTRWRFSLIPLGGYVKMLGDSDPSSTSHEEITSAEDKAKALYTKKPLQKIAVAAAGPIANYLLAFVVLVGLISFKGLPYLTTKIGGIQEGSVAEKAGLKEGDIIKKIDGAPVETFQELVKTIQTSSNNTLLFSVNREEITLEIPVLRPKEENGILTKLKTIGVRSAEPLYKSQAVTSSVLTAASICWNFSIGTLQGIWGMITKQKGAGEMGGILSIGDMTAQSFKGGIPSVSWFLAILSINLGLINLLPIPVLDGGHILLYSIEGIRGRPLAKKAQELIFSVGFFIVISLMIFATWKDLMRYKVFHLLKKWFI